ncbi:hypothetical protein HZC21_02275 [Candidatus Peregrinibacteria bacterium]|nr:hypothetical protein [Candidatus Peregrinibacteria bacterium]
MIGEGSEGSGDYMPRLEKTPRRKKFNVGDQFYVPREYHFKQISELIGKPVAGLVKTNPTLFAERTLEITSIIDDPDAKNPLLEIQIVGSTIFSIHADDFAKLRFPKERRSSSNDTKRLKDKRIGELMIDAPPKLRKNDTPEMTVLLMWRACKQAFSKAKFVPSSMWVIN